MQYVTYESMFAFAELIFSVIGAAAGIITLIIAIVKLHGSKGEKKRKK